MDRQEFINQLKARTEAEHTKYKGLPEDSFLDRAISLGVVKGLLLAWEIAQNMEK